MNSLGTLLNGGAAHSDRPHVVAFGGGKGGTGRSTLCAEIARSLARHNHRILCVDASWECPTLNTLLHAEEPRVDLSAVPALGEEGFHVADLIQETASRSIWLASLASGRRYPFVRPKLAGDLLVEQLHELDFDWIFLDLPPGIDPLAVELFILSDVPIAVATPEPAAVRQVTQFLRASLYQAIGYHPDAYELHEDLLDLLYQQPSHLNRDTLLRLAPSAEVRRVVAQTFERFEPYIIVNLVREGSERDLGFVLAHALFEELGVFPRYLGSVDYEDRRWFFNRRSSGQSTTTRGEEALSTDIEQLAKYIADLGLVEAKYPRPIPRDPDLHPALRIGLTPETGRNEVRQYCRRLWEGYRREASLSLIFADPERRLDIADQLETHYRKVLTLPSDSFAGMSADSGLTSMAEPSPPTRPEMRPTEPPREARRPPPARRPAREVSRGPAEEREVDEDSPYANAPMKGESPGRLIERLRRERKMSLQELSLRTHIGIKYLTAIEDADIEILPRPVYLRGYLREIARIFDVAAEPLIDEYFRFLGHG